MTRFYDLTVTNIKHTTRDAVIVTLAPKNGSFDFIQGQYLTFKRDFEGKEIRRSYSVCSGVGDDLLQVGIKRVDGGVFSTWANQGLKIGDKIKSMQPMGNFHTALDPTNAKTYLAVAAGSGITPVISTIRTILDMEPNSNIILIYANRGVSSIMFRAELDDLKDRFINRLNVIHILKSDAQNVDLFTGRIDAEKCGQLFTQWVDIGKIDTAFICGPEQLMQTVANALKEHGLGIEKINYELFSGSSNQGTAPAAPSTQALARGGTRASIKIDGVTRSIKIGKNQSLLEAGLAQNIDLPFSCRAGVCASCRCRIIKGSVEMMANHALEDYEVEKGYVLSCQSYPLSDEIIADYDQ